VCRMSHSKKTLRVNNEFSESSKRRITIRIFFVCSEFRQSTILVSSSKRDVLFDRPPRNERSYARRDVMPPYGTRLVHAIVVKMCMICKMHKWRYKNNHRCNVFKVLPNNFCHLLHSDLSLLWYKLLKYITSERYSN